MPSAAAETGELQRHLMPRRETSVVRSLRLSRRGLLDLSAMDLKLLDHDVRTFAMPARGHAQDSIAGLALELLSLVHEPFLNRIQVRHSATRAQPRPLT